MEIINYGQKLEKVIVNNQNPYDLYASNDKDSTNLIYYKLVPNNNPLGV